LSSGLNAFTKTGNTVAFVANTAAPTAVQCSSTTLGGNQYRVINTGTVTVFLGYGTTADQLRNDAAGVVTSHWTIISSVAID
jgi:gamma-glutamyltranspeptidase